MTLFPLPFVPELVTLALAATLGSAEAEDPRGGPGKGGGPLAKLCQAVECTDGQRAEMRRIAEVTREAIRTEHEAIRRLRGKMAEEFRRSKLDEKALRGLQADIARHQAKIGALKLDGLIKAHGLLDARQRAKLAEHIEQRRGRPAD